MSRTLPHSVQDSRQTSSDLSDTDWLKSLCFRSQAHETLRMAATQGQPVEFAQALHSALEHECRIGKRERIRLRGALLTLWTHGVPQGNATLKENSLAHCLFNDDLNRDELSGRLETIMAGAGEDKTDSRMLVAAYWLLRLRGKDLEPQTLFAFLRWTRTRTANGIVQTCQARPEGSSPEQGCAAFDLLELQTLLHLSLPGLKGEKKEKRQLARAWQQALDAVTDSDGTPHSRWLDEIFHRFCQLAAVTLYADSLNVPLWNKKDRKRLQGLLARTALMIAPRHVAFAKISPAAACGALLAIAEILHLEALPGLRSLLVRWEEEAIQPRLSVSPHPRPHKLPKANIQSDWGDWASLRSCWTGPVDQCLIRYHGPSPQLEVVVADLSLFAGNWEHALKIDGEPYAVAGEWTCCCWYTDRQVAFLELQLNRDDPVQVVRQALLLREESVLMLSDSIRTPVPASMEFSRSLPLTETWALEEDTLSRELALCQGSARVRLFPWSSPQMRLERSEETLSITPQQLHLKTRTHGRGLYSATLFDWSEKRREEPVDWQRVTVAEDGQIMPPETAVGHRLRLGKKQWVLYHSHQPPVFPRSVLGIHTLSETVFARLTPRGEVEMLVEVEL